MEILIYILIAIVVVLVGFVIFLKRKSGLPEERMDEQIIEDYGLAPIDNVLSELAIKFEMLPATQQIDEAKLVEIKDSKVLARVNKLVPEIAQAALSAGNAIQGNAQVLYRAIIPAGAKLTQSQNMAGAVRGLYHGTEGIKGHADFVAVNNTANVAANAVASAMNVASLVVGQYYMTQINAELSEISGDISKIANFQDNEYKSKVFALVAQMQKIASFKVEILENDELRRSEITNLNNWEQECIQLLGQANLTIAAFSKKGNLNYDAYEKELSEAQNWYVYQKTLVDVLYRIAELKHTLHLGAVSKEQCAALLSKYTEQVNVAKMQLAQWHQSQTERLGINIDAKNKKRLGFNGIIYKPLGLIKEDFNFRAISEKTADMINIQTISEEISHRMETIDLYQEDVRIIVKDDKMFYLPASSSEEANN